MGEYVPNPRDLKLVCVILNCIPALGGIGTIIGAVKDGMNVKALIVGILQFVLQIGVIGYIWSVIWAYLMWQE